MPRLRGCPGLIAWLLWLGGTGNRHQGNTPWLWVPVGECNLCWHVRRQWHLLRGPTCFGYCFHGYAACLQTATSFNGPSSVSCTEAWCRLCNCMTNVWCHLMNMLMLTTFTDGSSATGDKSEAKTMMSAAGVPIVPGYHGPDLGDQ